MELEIEPRKRKERSTNKAIDGTTVITPTRLYRQAKIRSQKAALKKAPKNGKQIRVKESLKEKIKKRKNKDEHK